MTTLDTQGTICPTINDLRGKSASFRAIYALTNKPKISSIMILYIIKV